MINRRQALLGACLGSVAAVCGGTFAALSRKRETVIQIWSDSTGNGEHDPREWPYLWADAAVAAGQSVEIMPWLVEAAEYGQATLLGDGTPEIQIRNFAVPGSIFEYPMGPLWDRAFGERPDFILVNLGLNHGFGLEHEVVRGEIAVGLGRMIAAFPGVPIACIKQNPFSDNAGMEMVFSILDEMANFYGIDLIDVGTKFRSRSGDVLYMPGDNTHPNQAGQDLYCEAMLEYWPRRTERPPSIPQGARNLLTNPNFDLQDGGVATGWDFGGTVTGSLSKSQNGKKLSAAGEGYAYIYQDVPPALLSDLKGSTISAGFEIALSDGASDGQGRIFVMVDDRMIQSRTFLPPGGIDGWRAICGVPIPDGAQRVRLGIFHDQNTTPSVHPLEIRSAFLHVGNFMTPI